MTDEAMRCGSCDGTLHESTVSGREIWGCSDCGGMLVEQRDLVPLLHHAASDLGDLLDRDTEIPPVPARPPPRCPDCEGAMSTFGYMGTRLVYPSRCSGCSVVWLAPEVFPTVTLLYARTNLREQLQVDGMQADMEERTRRFSAMMIARVRSNWIA